MAYSTVKFLLESTVINQTFYVKSGSTECINDKDIPTVFSATDPASGYATAKSSGDCAFKNSHIHLYFFTDEEYDDQIADIKLYEENGTDEWHVEVESVNVAYGISPVKDSNNEYTIKLSK